MWLCLAIVVFLIVGKDLGWKQRLKAHEGVSDESADPSMAWSGVK